MKILVWYKSDGTVSITHLAPRGRRPELSEEEQLMMERDRLRAVRPDVYGALPCEIMDATQLPQGPHDKGKRRGAPGQGVWLDHSIITPAERRAALEAELDAEHSKPSPGIRRIMEIERDLRRGAF